MKNASYCVSDGKEGCNKMSKKAHFVTTLFDLMSISNNKGGCIRYELKQASGISMAEVSPISIAVLIAMISGNMLRV